MRKSKESLVFRKYRQDDEVEILRLNKEYEQMLSPMDSSRFSELRKMVALLTIAEISGSTSGFIMCFTAGSKYDSPNYQWFSNNLERFLYIDRVVISDRYQQTGVASQLYAEVTKWALAHSLTKLVAEINIEPKNKPSLLFHQKMGFSEITKQKIGSNKVVSFQQMSIT